MDGVKAFGKFVVWVMETIIGGRRRIQRCDFAVAMLRKDAAGARRAKDPHMAAYLEGLADLIEASPSTSVGKARYTQRDAGATRQDGDQHG